MSGKAVVVTGASTGIGKACAHHLTRLGFKTFAGVRKDSDAAALKAEGLEPLKLDIVDAASVSAARTSSPTGRSTR
jgi:NAD(P)-dependent dehydrogenase (short-subunit alcohol dehydrogenase family)